jgi:hypothetical protein
MSVSFNSKCKHRLYHENYRTVYGLGLELNIKVRYNTRLAGSVCLQVPSLRPYAENDEPGTGTGRGCAHLQTIYSYLNSLALDLLFHTRYSHLQ